MEAWHVFVAAGIAGFGLGIGLLIGAYAVRGLRRFMRDEFPRNGRNGHL